MPASPKLKLVPADAKIWREAFLNLRSSVVPCPGFTLQSWGGAHEACVDFLDRWADEAVALGWTTLEVFGVHPEIGTIPVDFCGAMVLSAERVSGVSEKHMRFGNMTFYWDKPGRPEGAVPIWLFGR
ncbi:hypothetical protein ASF49_20430 [Methylobacterium sp. Leaf104]|uniref:hypothetical protein n=1 Tax=Methylobacterium TaxID=407 RepID=UPI0006F4B49F|nr:MULTISPECIES: hypothetical protein [Methylobacterium]KQP40738.1 hypothetical protein ASF49_20430 [Methylobacterium sp. Leaf104]MCI9881121.1 hypothetical protein [Methylobacterium goesingense]